MKSHPFIRFISNLGLLIFIVLIQSCVAYQKVPTTFNSALNMGPVKLVKNSGQVYKFKHIELDNDKYYGIGQAYSTLEYTRIEGGAKTVLDSANFSAIYLKDAKASKSKSIWLGIAIGAPVAFFMFIGLVLLSLS